MLDVVRPIMTDTLPVFCNYSIEFV